ncbi:hypothetical protein, partial [Priestia megaterium]|uniref:hypothetical protein n=1 Tax=Priestia megaterium TaxID=1404 RepID=UPI001C994BB1
REKKECDEKLMRVVFVMEEIGVLVKGVGIMCELFGDLIIDGWGKDDSENWERIIKFWVGRKYR